MEKKVAVVTGGGMGIGAAIASRLAHDGLTVVIADINTQAATGTADRLTSEGLEAWPLTLDVGKSESITAGFAAVEERYKRCDVLVNNAGTAKLFPFIDYPVDQWNLNMAVNVTGAMLSGQCAARLMCQRRWGRIINITSVSGIRASVGRTAYGTSKAALIGLTRQMAIELAKFGITVNGIAPGFTDTPAAREFHSAAFASSLLRMVPAARYGRPEEIAAAASFLCSEEAAYITGHIVAVDGGFLAAGIPEK